MYDKLFDDLSNKAAESIKAEQGDYIVDGLLYCGNCKTPKQTRVTFMGIEKTPYCLCKCEAEKRDREEEAIRQQEREKVIREYRKMGFPDAEMSNWSFGNDDMANPTLTKAMQAYVEHFGEFRKTGKGLLLHGTVGTGKTYAACEVANALVDKGYPVLVTNFARLTNTIQGLFEGKQEYIDSLNRFTLLVIDDLGAERKSEFMQEMVFNIVDSRYRAGLPMIVTTNLDLSEITNPKDIGNARIYDRILERCHPIEVKGASRRRKAVREEYNEMQRMLGL